MDLFKQYIGFFKTQEEIHYNIGSECDEEEEEEEAEEDNNNSKKKHVNLDPLFNNTYIPLCNEDIVSLDLNIENKAYEKEQDSIKSPRTYRLMKNSIVNINTMEKYRGFVLIGLFSVACVLKKRN
jgi:hypothetical protein